MSAALMQVAEESILAARLQRQALASRLYAAGETKLADEGLVHLDDPMGPWLAWEADARSVLDESPIRGQA